MLKLLVKTAQLSPIIKTYIERHNRNFPMRMGGNQNTVNDHTPTVQGADYICQRAGIGRVRLDNIIKCNRPFLDFSVADKIMVAIERQDCFTNGEVDVLD